jgi:hypothetical protein
MNTLKSLVALIAAGLLASAASAQMSTPIFQFKKVKEPTPEQLAAMQATSDTLKSAKFASLLPLQKFLFKGPRTYNFLSTKSAPSAFTIGDLRHYNIDTLNKYFYNQGGVSVLQSAMVENFNGAHTYINAELASFLFGPVRLGVSGVFQTKGDTTKDNAIKSNLEKVMSNGGTFNLNFLVPLFFSRSRTEQVHFGIFAQMNHGISPGVDSTGATDYSKDVAYTNQTGLNFHFDVGSNDKKARLSFDIPLYCSISSKNVNSEYGLPNYLAAKFLFGAVLGDLARFQLSGPIISSASKIRNAPWTISIQFAPAQLVD